MTRKAAAAPTIASPTMTGRTYPSTPKFCTGVSCATDREFFSVVPSELGGSAADDDDGSDEEDDDADGSAELDEPDEGEAVGLPPDPPFAGDIEGTAPFCAATAFAADTAYAASAPRWLAAVIGSMPAGS
jgi:hypothetical protein